MYTRLHINFYFEPSFLVEQDEKWIADKATLVDYLKSIWNTNTYHSQMSWVSHTHQLINQSHLSVSKPRPFSCRTPSLCHGGKSVACY